MVHILRDIPFDGHEYRIWISSSTHKITQEGLQVPGSEGPTAGKCAAIGNLIFTVRVLRSMLSCWRASRRHFFSERRYCPQDAIRTRTSTMQLSMALQVLSQSLEAALSLASQEPANPSKTFLLQAPGKHPRVI